MTYRWVQVLRGMLSLSVALIHIKIFLTRAAGDAGLFNNIPDSFGNAPCVFFVISGYFMAMLIDRREKHFLLNRVIRIYPPYILAIFLAYLLRFDTKKLFTDLYAVITLLPLGSGLDYKLGIEWSLIYEIFFYFLCAFYARPDRAGTFPKMLIAWYLATLVAAMYVVVPVLPNMLNIWASSWNLCFIGGALVYHLLLSYRKPAVQFWAVCVTLATAAAYIFAPSGRVQGLISYAIFSPLLLIALIGLERVIRAPRVFVKLGDYSYALYLIHVSIILTTLKLWEQFVGTPPTSMTGVLALILCLLSCWAFGFVDVSMHNRLKAFVKKKLAARHSAVIPTNEPACAPAVAGGNDGPRG
jgi:exopolysaccharide production protein ExoZ